jgi:HPt (histidine-containing phosphotransfer) domain-containing protein
MPTEPLTMLLRLSRVSFWMSAAVAAMALLAPGGHETLLTGIAVAASAAAFGLWRSGVSAQRHQGSAAAIVPGPIALTQASLLDAAAMIAQQAGEAASFEAALHAVAHVLRGELGARNMSVHEVRDIGATHAQVAEAVQAQPGFQARARPVRLDAGPLGESIRTQAEAGAPPGAVAVPVLREGRVVAVIELNGFDVPVEPQALAGLLRLARQTLSQWAPTARGRKASHSHGLALVVEDSAVQPDPTARMLRRVGCRATPASGMLEGLNASGRTQFDDDHVCQPLRRNQMLVQLKQHLRLRAPDEARESGEPARESAAASGPAEPVLDPAALARLTELDPTGANHLLARVLRAFQTSVARLRPQADAARLSGDQAGLRLVAHTLKSSSASIGAMHLSQLCAQIETTIRTANGDDLDAQLDALGVELDAVLAAIEQLLKEPV